MSQITPAERIWLPGQGVVDLAPMRVHRAVQAYDERLIFGRINDQKHPGFGDWCVFVKMPHGQNPVPVLGFGKNEMPEPEEVIRRCDQANTRKHGDKLLRLLRQEADERKAMADAASLANAEVYADIMKEAKGVKAPQISVPRGV